MTKAAATTTALTASKALGRTARGAVAALLLILAPPVRARASQSLDGSWRFHAGGDERLAAVGVDDAAWSAIEVPGPLPEGGWLRRRISGAALAGSEPLAVLLPAEPMHVRGYQLFVDGVAVGGVGTPGSLLAPAAGPALHRLPAGATGDGEVVLAVHLGAGGQVSGGWLLGPAGALEAPFAQAKLAQREAVGGDLFGAGFFAFVMLYHLEMFRRRRVARANLWFALLCAGALGVNLTGMAIPLAVPYLPAAFLWFANTAAATLAIASLIRFAWELIEQPRPRWARILGRVVAVSGAAASLAQSLLPLAAVVWVGALIAVGVTIVIAARRGHPEARVVAAGMAVFVLLLVVNIVDSVTVHVLPNEIAIVAFATLILAMAFSLAQRFARSYQEIDLLNKELRRQIAERARELSDTLAGLGSGDGHGPWGGSWSPQVEVDGRYRIVRLLGVGGMGSVYEAEGIEQQRRVALKRLRHFAGPAEHARLAREAQLAARLDHPNLVPVIDVGVTADGVYLVMELVAGSSLEEDRARFGDVGFARPILAQVAAGLAYMHGQGVIHRDLKPSNILIERGARGTTPDRPVARIADFGIAGLFVAPSGDGPRPAATPGDPATRANVYTLTATGAVMGTPAYMAPEQGLGAGHAGPAADVFAFGIIAYELLTGSSPFNPPAVRQQLAGLVPALAGPLTQTRVDLDPAVVGLLDRCLAVPPDSRPSATEVARALASFAA